MSKFLEGNRYANDTLDNITIQAEQRIIDTIQTQYIDGTTGKFKVNYLPDISLTSITVVTNESERLSLVVESGDACKQTDNSTFWMYDGSSWIQITDPSTLATLLDTDINTPLTGHVLRHNGSTWVNSVLSHNDLSGIGSYNHAQIDTHVDNSIIHITDSSIHFTEAEIDHNNILNKGSNTHAQIDAALTTSSNHQTDNSIHRDNNTYWVSLGNSSGINNSEYDINIGAGSGYRSAVAPATRNISIGQDSGSSSLSGNIFIGEASGPYDSDVQSSICIGGQAGYYAVGNNTIILNATGYDLNSTGDNKLFIAPIQNISGNTVLQYNDTTKEITHNILDHSSLNEIGSNSHSAIDSHISDSTIHFTEGSISHSNIIGSGSVSHSLLDTFYNLLTTEGDILYRNATVMARLGKGTNGQILKSTATTIQWDDPSASVSSLNDLSDCVITSPAVRHILNHNGTNFVNTSTPTLDYIKFNHAEPKRRIVFYEPDTPANEYEYVGFYCSEFAYPLFTRFGVNLFSSTSFQVSNGNPSLSENYLFTCSASGKGYFKTQLSIGTFSQDYALTIGSTTSGLINRGSNQLSTSSTSWTLVSSKEFKRNITPCSKSIKDCLDDLLSVKVVKYQYRDSDEYKTGIIAEDLLKTPLSCCVKYIPKMEMKDNKTGEDISHENVPCFDAENMMWAMLRAIQSLILIRNTQESRMSILEAKNKTLEDRLKALEDILFV